MKTDYKTLQKKMEENQLTYSNNKFYDDGLEISNKVVCKLFKCMDSELEMSIKDLEKYNDSKFNTSLDGPFGNNELDDVYNQILDVEGLTLDLKEEKYYTTKNGIKEFMSEQEFSARLTFRINEYKLTTPTKITEKMMEQYFMIKILNTKRDNVQFIKESIEYKSEHSGFSDEYLTRMHKIFDISQDLDIFLTLMKHFIWQVKRRSSCKKTYYDIMIAFFGAQGIGKSYVMNAIFGSVLGELYSASEDLESILEKNNARLLIDQFIINIEELAKTGESLNVDTGAKFKKLMTDEFVTYRPFFTQRIVKEPIRVSFIATANKHIYTLIKDQTGMRRFFEFSSQLEPNNVINDIDSNWLRSNALKFFQSIDDSLDKGYWQPNSEIGAKITEIQKSYSSNATNDWLSSNYVKDTKMNWSNCLSLKEIYDSYNDYYKSTEQDTKYKKSKEGLFASIETEFGIKGLCCSHANKEKLRLKPKPTYIPQKPSNTKIEEEDNDLELPKKEINKGMWDGVE